MKRFLTAFTAILCLVLATPGGYPDSKISGLTTEGSATGSDQIPVNHAGTNYSITVKNIADYAVKPRLVSFSFDGGGSALATSATVTSQPFLVEYAGTLTSAIAMCDQTGTINVDVWKTNAAVPSSGNIINSGHAVAIASGTYSRITTFTGWSTTAIAAQDVLRAQIESGASGCTKLTVILGITPTNN